MAPALRVLLAAALALAALTAQSATALTVTGLPKKAPLAVAATHDGTTLHIVATIDAGWHLYGRDVGGGQPVTVTIDGGAFAANGQLTTPMDAAGLITGTAELRLPLRRTSPGDELRASMKFMVCDALQCLPPIVLSLRTEPAGAATTGPLRVLLVALDESERTQRIAGFLTARGLVPTVTTWAKVTTELCDAADVVIADSPTFMARKGVEVRVENFPATRSPIVAVNYLGTQLLEANKIAMACGYI